MYRVVLYAGIMVWVSAAGAQNSGAATQASLPAWPVAPDTLTLAEALSLSVANHPGLEAHRKAVSARQAGLSQASRGVNPELAVEVEDVAGTGAYRGVSAAQTTLQLAQTFEWGGKRGRRERVAAAEKNLAERDLDRKRMEIQALTFGHFMEALHAQRRLALAVESKTLAERLLEAVTRRVEEGAASMADGIRARLAVSEAGMEARQDTLRLAAAKQKLALLWGGGESESRPPLRDELDSLRSVSPLASLFRNIESGPVAASKTVGIRLAEAKLDQQLGFANPDITVNAGFRHMAEPGDLAWVGGISMPLPVRNRNQGGREGAKFEVEQAQADRRETLLELKSRVGDVHKDLLLAREEIGTLSEVLVPDALKAAAVLEEGYRRGRFGMLEVLNAESDLFRYRLRYLDALLRYQLGYAELERLIGSEAEMSGRVRRDAPHGKED